MKKKVVASVISELEIDTDWYTPESTDEYISKVEGENLIEWFMENIISVKIEVKDI